MLLVEVNNPLPPPSGTRPSLLTTVTEIGLDIATRTTRVLQAAIAAISTYSEVEGTTVSPLTGLDRTATPLIAALRATVRPLPRHTPFCNNVVTAQLLLASPLTAAVVRTGHAPGATSRPFAAHPARRNDVW